MSELDTYTMKNTFRDMKEFLDDWKPFRVLWDIFKRGIKRSSRNKWNKIKDWYYGKAFKLRVWYFETRECMYYKRLRFQYNLNKTLENLYVEVAG